LSILATNDVGNREKEETKLYVGNLGKVASIQRVALSSNPKSAAEHQRLCSKLEIRKEIDAGKAAFH